MAHHNHASAQTCSNCDGHASAAITLGGRDHHGHLRTITAHCPACNGVGTLLARRPATSTAVSA
ncbi:hypothetical protein Q5762_34395 [Streptomyces sp. P9(2023)]|uniref:hypothetical protein n=1 Tax=Streptomyces sp. P9(2023) TaxID=3064394 RepID=UPI0028F40423|nr:hypothetical protein [Streptomyces sp. P9(2023)]MDT9693329.1 hypothetical protein [Streptomyces sp. P9(2023)]